MAHFTGHVTFTRLNPTLGSQSVRAPRGPLAAGNPPTRHADFTPGDPTSLPLELPTPPTSPPPSQVQH